MPLVSIIVPCYNAESWIKRSINSILTQAIYDIEVIVINDGSTDGSMQVLSELENCDKRLKVINKKNGGVSSARNTGLSLSTGDWIVFVDIDDEILNGGLGKMLNVVNDVSDIVFAGYTTNGESKVRGRNRTVTISAEKLAVELFAPTDYPYLGYPWAKLFRRSIIEKHHLRFNESIKYNEDRLFTFSYLSHIKQGVYTTEPVYDYIQHGDNAMSAINGPGYWKFETDLDAFIEMNKIAPAFESEEITRLVRLGTITSYRWNKRLNKQYGNNNSKTNQRLKKKLFSVVPRSMLVIDSLQRKYNLMKSKLYWAVVKFGIK